MPAAAGRGGACGAGAARCAVGVACSGGTDSLALLHATVRTARALSLRVVALHVHHGLHPAADAWLETVRGQCAAWTADGLPVAFAAERLDGGPARSESVEAWARRGRYAALARLAHASGCTLVLLAQHRRDQAETVLLQALRGGGPAALAGMARERRHAGLVWVRPWLAAQREAIEAYAGAHGLQGVVDPSNADPRLARGRLRTQLWPALRSAFPHAESQLEATALRAAEAAAVLSEVAAADLRRVTAAQPQALQRAAWQGLSAARRRGALRAWLSAVQPHPVPETLVRRLAEELPAARGGARWPGPRPGPGRRATPGCALAVAWIVLRGDRLVVEHTTVAAPAGAGGRPSRGAPPDA